MNSHLNNEIGWVKFTELRGFGPLGVDSVLIAGNSWLMVVNTLAPYKQAIYQAEEGVQVAAGHRQLPCVVYAQRSNQPLLLVLVYPGFKVIRTISGAKNDKYLFVDFCDLEILVTLVQKVDSIDINIWNWRTVERMVVVSPTIQSPMLHFSVSAMSPIRFVEWDNLRMNIWQLHPSFKKLLSARSEILLAQLLELPIDVAWNAEGDCYILDSNATIFTVNFEMGVLQKELNLPRSEVLADAPPCVACHSLGLVAYAQGQLSLTVKKGDEWSTAFTIKCQPTVGLIILPNQSAKEAIMGWSQSNTLFTVTHDKTGPKILKISNCTGGFDKLCVIKPECLQFLSHQTNSNQIILWDLNTGLELDEINVRDAPLLVMVCSNQSHVVLGFQDGFIDILAFGTLSRITLFPTRQPIDALQFMETAEIFCACSRKAGEFFLIQKINELWEIVAYLEADYKIVSFIIRETPQISLFVLSSSSTSCRIGGNMVRVYVLENRTFVLNKAVVLDQFYTEMTQKQENILLVPFRSKSIHIFDETLQRTGFVQSGHLISQFRVLVTESIITYGIDGLINFHKGSEKNWLLSFHRTDGGVAILDASGSSIIAGASNGCFVSYRIGLTNEKKPNKVGQFRLLENEENITWLEKRHAERLKGIFEMEKERKNNVRFKLDTVKQRIKKLLDRNEICPDDEKLAVSCFELDTAGRAVIKDVEKSHRSEIHQFECARIQAQDALSSRIIETTWDLMETPAKELRPILTQSCSSVHSYGLFRAEDRQKLAWINERIALIRDFHNFDYLEAWLPQRDKQSRRGVSRKVSLVEDALDPTGKKRLPFYSTSSHLFLPAGGLPHSELQVHTQHQAKDLFVLTEITIRELMAWFNQEFSVVASEKDRELRSLADRRGRLRQVTNELKELGGPCDLLSQEIDELRWSASEKPELFLKVFDSELNEPLYMTEEELEMERATALTEAVRLEKLRSDDFRERALDVMMDGVLNKKWQDEIKKDVAKPSFMDDKKSEEFTEEENRRVKIYQDAVEKLQLERERYKKLLVAEFKQLAASAQETGTRFDGKLKQLHRRKLRIESAICQEQLNSLRFRMEIMEKISLTRKEERLSCAITRWEKKLEILLDEATKLQDALSEARTFYETLMTRDKNMEKSFKKDFPEYSPIICELLNKLSKKRPKFQGRGANNAALLTELGRYVIQADDRSHRLPMPQECIEYLKGLDQLDMAVNIPVQVNENSWETLCRLRRAKIDSELKIRAVGIDVTETEQTAMLWQKMIKGCRETISRKQAELEGLLNAKRMNELDCSVQIVVSQRIVEVPTTGKMSDFSGAVLLSRALIDNVNEAIQNAGEQKVKAMEKACEFRKGIMFKEWQHQKLRLQVEDFKAQLDTLEHVHVTKELQEILNSRARGDYVEKGFANLEKEIHAVNVRFQRAEVGLLQTIDDYERKISELDQLNNELDLQIVSLNKNLGKRTLLRDVTAEQNAEKEAKFRMKNIARRGRLVTRTQELAAELAALQAERDLLRLKAYPTLT